MTDYMDEVVTRCAPRWAWEIMIDVLWTYANNRPTDPGSDDIRLAIRAYMMACETPNLAAMGRAYVAKFED